MKRKGYSEEQFVAAVKQQELGARAAYIARKPGIAEQTSFRRKKQCGVLEANELSEFKQVRERNPKLNKLVVDLNLGRL